MCIWRAWTNFQSIVCNKGNLHCVLEIGCIYEAIYVGIRGCSFFSMLYDGKQNGVKMTLLLACGPTILSTVHLVHTANDWRKGNSANLFAGCSICSWDEEDLKEV